jgi:hypothetical protein
MSLMNRNPKNRRCRDSGPPEITHRRASYALFLSIVAKFSENRNLAGRADALCPVASHVDLLGDCQGVVDVNAKVAHGALYLGVA